MKKNKMIVSLFATVFLNFNVMQVLACNAPSTCTQKVNTSCSGTSKDSKTNKCESDRVKDNWCQPNNCVQKSCELTVQNYCKSTAYNTPASGAVVATDKSKHTLAYTKACDPCHGSVTVNSNGTWTYQPKTGFTGCDSFKVKVSDEKATAVSTVSITVEKPKLTVPNYNVETNADAKEVKGKVVRTDADGDKLCYSVTTEQKPKYGTVTINKCTGDWVYIPNTGVVVDDSF